jgi:hypothetical protein
VHEGEACAFARRAGGRSLLTARRAPTHRRRQRRTRAGRKAVRVKWRAWRRWRLGVQRPRSASSSFLAQASAHLGEQRGCARIQHGWLLSY